MGLQRDVAQILQRDDPERVGVIEHCRHRQRHLMKQPGDVRERQRRKFDRAGVQREHNRRAVRRDDAEVLAIGGVARQRYDAGGALGETAIAQVLIDPVPYVGAFSRSLVEHCSPRAGVARAQ